MAHVPLPVPLVPQEAFLAALAALARVTALPLTDPEVPVRLPGLPLAWRTYLHDEADDFADLVLPGEGEVRLTDWARLLASLRRSIETPYRMAEILARTEQGPEGEDLARAPRLSPWMPALAMGGAPAVAGHVTDHPKLGAMWMKSSLVMGLDPAGRWARTWSRWYILGECMTEDDLPMLWQAGVAIELLDEAHGALEEHFADLRPRVGQLLASLAPLVEEGRSWSRP